MMNPRWRMLTNELSLNKILPGRFVFTCDDFKLEISKKQKVIKEKPKIAILFSYILPFWKKMDIHRIITTSYPMDGHKTNWNSSWTHELNFSCVFIFLKYREESHWMGENSWLLVPNPHFSRPSPLSNWNIARANEEISGGKFLK